MRTRLLALLLPALLTACGFHLRQAPDLPPQMQRIYIAAPGGNGDLLRELRRGLESDDTEVTTDPTGATTILSVISVSHENRPIAIDRRGVALEYQLITQVEFSMMVDNVTVIQPQVVTLTRNYAYSNANAIANEEQEDNLNKAIAKDVSEFIIFRVVAAAKTVAPVYRFPGVSTHPAPAVAAPIPAPGSASTPPPV